MFAAPAGGNTHALAENRALYSVPGAFPQRAGCRSPSSASPGSSIPKLGGKLVASSPMERNAAEYSQTDPASAAQYSIKQEVSYSNQATPTSEYGVYPSSARSSNFSDHISRPYHQSPAQHSSSNGATPSPAFQYSPYGPHGPGPHIHHLPPGAYQSEGGGGGAIYHGRADHGRLEWHSFPHGSPIPPSMQGFSFVAIPGSQQHKRPRRKYEEIERMYKCGFQGCEKAYGTLNHLNAHVTMQSHGNKRTPDEFKEVRKEWRLRKKEEDTRLKERQIEEATAAGVVVQHSGENGHRPGPDESPVQAGYPVARGPVLAPLGYQGAQYPATTAGPVPHQQLPEYSSTTVYPTYSPNGANYPPGTTFTSYPQSMAAPATTAAPQPSQ